MVEKLTILAVGDVCVNRDKPETIFAHTASVLRGADISVCQLEALMSERGSPAVTRALCVHPRNASALKYAGFDVVTFASNHVMDMSYDAFFDTIEVVKKQGIPIIGVGKNREEAHKPAILERKGTKVGFLSYNSILPHGLYIAGERNPGCAAIRASTLYEMVEAGQPGTPCRIITIPNRQDLEAMKEDVRKLKAQVDIVIACFHFGLHFVPFKLAMYQKDIAYAAIDAGADLIVGHHAHILKGIEVYKGKVITYSLCNFAFDRPIAKEDLNLPLYDTFRELYPNYRPEERLKEYPTYPFPVDSRKTILIKCIVSNKKIERVSFLPVMVNRQTQPEILPRKDKRSAEVVNYMRRCCKDQGLDTRLRWDGDEVVIVTR